MTTTLRPAVPADFLELQGEPPAHRCQCITLLVDGRVVATGGLTFKPDGIWASALISPEARRHRYALHRAGHRAVAQWRRMGLRQVLAAAEPGNPAAERWLRRFGFVAELLRDGGSVFVWTRE